MHAIGKIFRTDLGELALLVESTLALCFACAALRTVKFRKVYERLDRRAGGMPTPATGEQEADVLEAIDRIGWAIAAAARRISTARCLESAVAAHVMLRRRKLQPRLRVGVRKAPSGTLHAHAWTVCRGRVVTGSEPGREGRLTQFAELLPVADLGRDGHSS